MAISFDPSSFVSAQSQLKTGQGKARPNRPLQPLDSAQFSKPPAPQRTEALDAAALQEKISLLQTKAQGLKDAFANLEEPTAQSLDKISEFAEAKFNGESIFDDREKSLAARIRSAIESPGGPDPVILEGLRTELESALRETEAASNNAQAAFPAGHAGKTTLLESLREALDRTSAETTHERLQPGLVSGLLD